MWICLGVLLIVDLTNGWMVGHSACVTDRKVRLMATYLFDNSSFQLRCAQMRGIWPRSTQQGPWISEKRREWNDQLYGWTYESLCFPIASRCNHRNRGKLLCQPIGKHAIIIVFCHLSTFYFCLYLSQLKTFCIRLFDFPFQPKDGTILMFTKN